MLLMMRTLLLLLMLWEPQAGSRSASAPCKIRNPEHQKPQILELRSALKHPEHERAVSPKETLKSVTVEIPLRFRIDSCWVSETLMRSRRTLGPWSEPEAESLEVWGLSERRI